MHIICDRDFKIDEPTIVTIGKFDGEHIGHRKLFKQMKKEAKLLGLKTAVFSFDIPPASILHDKKTALISSREEIREKLSKEGIDYLIEYPIDKEVLGMHGRDFVYNILLAKMNMKAIIAGEDCAFGSKKSGNAELLKELSKKNGYKVFIIEKQRDELNREISSSLIRSQLSDGNIEIANKLLGSIYSIQGEVLEGNKIGKSIGFPTVNIYPPPDKHLAKLGVYATRVRLIDDGRIFESISNIGKNPSIEEDKKGHITRVETYIFDFDENLYGKKIEVMFYKFIREEKKFFDLSDLKKQISVDKEIVREYFRTKMPNI